MIAALPMYDRPETRRANDRLWAGIRTALGYGPETLTRNREPFSIWEDPALLLAQTCGLPYRTRLHGRVALVGAPDYGLEGCAPGYYNSVFVTRSGEARTVADYAGRRLAYNESGSQSGWAAAQTHAAGLGFSFTNLLRSGAHIESARAVADGRADITALDALSWELIRQYDDFAGGLQVIGRTRPTPALPFITARDTRPGPLFDAVSSAITGLNPSDREILHLRAIVAVAEADYLAVPTPPGPDAA